MSTLAIIILVSGLTVALGFLLTIHRIYRALNWLHERIVVLELQKIQPGGRK